MSIRRAKVGADVAAEKGSGAEGRLRARGRCWQCGEDPYRCRIFAESYPAFPVGIRAGRVAVLRLFFFAG